MPVPQVSKTLGGCVHGHLARSLVVHQLCEKVLLAERSVCEGRLLRFRTNTSPRLRIVAGGTCCDIFTGFRLEPCWTRVGMCADTWPCPCVLPCNFFRRQCTPSVEWWPPLLQPLLWVGPRRRRPDTHVPHHLLQLCTQQR